jgi:alpha-galactosidase/6-phospho-beta-glucosidase family protein
VRAAVSGDRSAALKALLAHPLVGQWGKVEPLLDGLLGASAGARA